MRWIFVPEIGTILAGKYRLEQRLGTGGFASVWAARNIIIDRPVALKILSAPVFRLPGAVDRFIREAKLTAMELHPTVVRVEDLGQTDEKVPFLVMELLRGQPLEVDRVEPRDGAAERLAEAPRRRNEQKAPPTSPPPAAAPGGEEGDLLERAETLRMVAPPLAPPLDAMATIRLDRAPSMLDFADEEGEDEGPAVEDDLEWNETRPPRAWPVGVLLVAVVVMMLFGVLIGALARLACSP